MVFSSSFRVLRSGLASTAASRSWGGGKARGGLAQWQLEHAKGRQAFPRCLAAKCLRLCLNARCGIFFSSDL